VAFLSRALSDQRSIRAIAVYINYAHLRLTARILPIARPSFPFKRKAQWLTDVGSRQQNIVFPNTVQNQGRFWRNLYAKQSFTVGQWIGVLIILFAYTFLLVSLIVADFPRGSSLPLWEKILNAYGMYFLLWLGIVLFVILANRRFRRKHRQQSRD